MKYAVGAGRGHGNPGHRQEMAVAVRISGRDSRTINDIHVPVNKPVKFIMTSEDVLHDFFVPDMRVKHDIVPGRYTADLVYSHRARRARFHLRRILRQGSLRHEGEG